jgi:tetratricopeptide (TPR) repeat protein
MKLQQLKNKNILSLQKALLVVLPLLLYLNTIQHGFVLDDLMLITGNEYTTGKWEGFQKIWTNDAFAGYLGEGKTLLPGGRYRPLSQALFNLYYTGFGEKAMGLHLANILLFMLTAVMLFKNLRNILGSTKSEPLSVAFIASLLYVVHPLHTEVVANIKSMDYLLSMFFAMLTLHYSLSYQRHKKLIYLLPLAPALMLSILAKETGLTFLALIPLSLYFVQARLKDKIQWKPIIVSFAVLLSTTVVYLIIRMSILGNNLDFVVSELLNNPFLDASTSEKYATIVYTWFVYLKLVLIPFPLTHDYYPYVIEITTWKNPIVLLTLLLFAGSLIYALWSLYRSLRKRVAFTALHYGILFFLVVFSISSNLFINIGAFMNERFLFIADIGLFIMIAYGIHYLANRNPNRRILLSVALFIGVGIFATLTVKRNPAWKNDYTLFTTDVQTSHNSAKCTVSAGGKTLDKAMEESNPGKRKQLLIQAQQWVSKGVEIHPKYFQGWLILGNIYYELNDYPNTYTCYDNCIRLAGGDSKVLNNMRNLVIKAREAGLLELSNKALNQLLRFNYQRSNTIFLQILNLEKAGKVDSALNLAFQFIQEDSTHVDTYNKLGQMLGQYKGDVQLSEFYLLKAYELDPGNFSVLENLGTLYAVSQDLTKALYFFKESYKANPDNKQIYQNIIQVYMALGNMEEAKNWQNKAAQRFGSN